MKPPGPARGRTVVHLSNSEMGGAERSLLAALAAEAAGSETPAIPPLFLVPREGPMSAEIAARGWESAVLPWPRGFASLTQGRWFALPLLPGLLPYLIRLARALGGADRIWSSGAKSHAACLALSPWLRGRLLFDLRDFLRSAALRKAIAFAARRFGCAVAANSKAVAADYPGAHVVYPRVSLARPPADRRDPAGKRIVSHLAFFAPYKGQDLFLQCARALVDAGVDAEFWLIGDVIYPASAYARYRDEVYAQAARLRLESRVRFLGNVPGVEVQELLERTHLLLHCTREPEPYGRAPMEALLCGCEVICQAGSGVCETTETSPELPAWASALGPVLGPGYVALSLPRGKPA